MSTDQDGKSCKDCGAQSVTLRWVRLLTASDCWLCDDAIACRARLAKRRSESTDSGFER